MALVAFVAGNFQPIRWFRSGSSRDPPARDQADEDHDDGNHQKDMNESTHGGARHQTERPQNQEHYRNCPQHMSPFD
jgi:hypothetical protein